MTEYIKREDALKAMEWKWAGKAAFDAVKAIPSADVVTREQYEQIHWERDVALHQLEEIGKGLGEKMVDAVEIKKDGEWDMFDLISSAYYGKGMYFKQDNGTVYSRHSGGYMTFDEAIREFVSLIDEDVICVPSVTTVWDDGEAPTYVLQKRGEWFDRGSLSCRCSNCGCKANKEYSFCPNCGADMRGRKDERTD